VFKTLRSQYFLGGFITMLVMFGLLLWNAQLLIGQALEDRFAAEMGLASPLITAAVAPLLATRDYAALQEVVHQSTQTQALAFLEVLDTRGRLVAQSGPGAEASAALRIATVPVEIAGQRLGQVRFGLVGSALQEVRARLLRSSLAIGGALLVLGLAALAFWATWLSAGFARLAKASQRVADGDYSLSLPGSRVRELAQVSDAFNRMSAAVRTQFEALRDSEQQQRSLMASMAGGLLVQDAQQRVIHSNDAALRLLGVSSLSGRMPEARDPEGRLLTPEQMPAALALQTGQPQRDVLLQFRHVRGAVRWLSVNAEPRFHADAHAPATPHVEAVVSTLTDVTRHVLAEQELRNLNEGLESRVQRRTLELQRARDEAERASLAKSQFLSRMSHELRTPLNAMLGFAQLLSLSRERLRDSELDKVRQIENAGWHLLDLINDVLDLSRIEAGEMSTSIEPVLVAELVSETVQMLSTQAQAQGVRIIEHAAPQLWARADRKRLKQVLNNLLSNAIKYNQAGGSVTLEVSALPAQQQLLVSVTDTGRGMNAQQLANLYQPFVRFEQGNDLTAGTGIGLVITKRLVELMGGQISVESRPGLGTRFSVTLVASAASPFSPPFDINLDDDAEAAPLHEPLTGVSRRLLYIEDNPTNAELVRRMLRQQRPEFDLRIAVDGLSGLAMVEERRPHLILIDIGLPGIDGLEVCRRLRADPANAGMPLIAFSANAMPSDVRDAQAAGFDAYLTKPIDLPELLEHIDRLLNERAFSASAWGELHAPL